MQVVTLLQNYLQQWHTYFMFIFKKGFIQIKFRTVSIQHYEKCLVGYRIKKKQQQPDNTNFVETPLDGTYL